MTRRENFFQTIRFGKPAYIMHTIPEVELSYSGCHHEDANGIGHDRPTGDQWIDIWGVGWQKDLPEVMGFPRHHPLAELDAMDHHQFPDTNAATVYEQIFEQKRDFDLLTDQDWILSGSHRDTLWERAYMLVGMEDLMVAFYTEPNRVKALLEKIMDFQMGIAKHYIGAGVDMVNMSDDMGMQHGLLLGEKIFDEFLLPQYQRLFDLYDQHQVIIRFHSCGHIEPLLGRFMDLGVKILNPIQATANNLDRVRQITKGRVVLHGGVNSQIVLEGTPEQVEACVRERIAQLGSDGGYICAPDQYLPYPKQNIDALKNEVEKYGGKDRFYV